VHNLERQLASGQMKSMDVDSGSCPAGQTERKESFVSRDSPDAAK